MDPISDLYVWPYDFLHYIIILMILMLVQFFSLRQRKQSHEKQKTVSWTLNPLSNFHSWLHTFKRQAMQKISILGNKPISFHRMAHCIISYLRLTHCIDTSRNQERFQYTFDTIYRCYQWHHVLLCGFVEDNFMVIYLHKEAAGIWCGLCRVWWTKLYRKIRVSFMQELGIPFLFVTVIKPITSCQYCIQHRQETI